MCKLKFVVLSVVLLGWGGTINANKLNKAFKALNQFNYFEAKRFFEKSMKKQPVAAMYGLSNIYYRNDNPFFNIDSAYKYILEVDDNFDFLPDKTKLKYANYNLKPQAIDSLKELIYARAFAIYTSSGNIDEVNKFIDRYHDAPQRHDAIDLRNSIIFKEVKKQNTYQAYQNFINTYPKAKEIPEAHEKYELTYFHASTKNNTLHEYEMYLKNRPNTPFLKDVENSIYTLSTPRGTIDEYHNFVKKYPHNHHVPGAWRNIYTIYTADYKTESLVDFKLEFPDYPFGDVVTQEIELSQKQFYPVRENGKWGFADSTGTVLIPCTFEWVEDFTEGVAECGLSGKSGFVNKAGKVTIPCEYDQVEPFKHGLSVVEQNKKMGVINKTGKLIVPFEYDEISEFSEGLAAVSIMEKYGYIDETGKLVMSIQYTKAGDFNEGLAAVEADGKSGYINKLGAIAIPLSFEWCEKFVGGFAKVKIDKKYGLIRKNGSYFLPCEYDLIGEFAEDAILLVKDTKYGFADRNGNVFIPLDYDYNGSSIATIKFENGAVTAEKHKKQGLIDKTNKYITAKDFVRIEPYSEGLAAAKKKEKWGYIDEKQKVQIQYNFLSAESFIDGMAKVKDKSGKTGFIGHNGKPIIDFSFDEAGVFKNGLCDVVIDEKTGFIDAQGTWIIPCEMDAVTPLYGGAVLKLEKNSKLAYFSVFRKTYFWKEYGF